MGPPQDVAGIVHRGEYVFDAAATSRIGLQNLEAMRAGRSSNDNGDVVAELRALRSELASVKGELAQVTRTIALSDAETRETIKQGNKALGDMSKAQKLRQAS